MKKLLITAGAVAGLMFGTSAALAAGGAGHIEDHSFAHEGPFGKYDQEQLQRGFQVYYEVCAACHGLKFVSFRELGNADGPGFPEEQVKAFASNFEVYDPELEPGETRPAVASDKFPANTGAGAPDLSMMAKARAGFHGPNGLGIICPTGSFAIPKAPPSGTHVPALFCAFPAKWQRCSAPVLMCPKAMCCRAKWPRQHGTGSIKLQGTICCAGWAMLRF